MLSHFLEKHHIILQRGHSLAILLRLLLNRIQLCRLRIHKLFSSIHHPIVHYYAVCWNEERMLPFMFKHHEGFVDHFYIYDNHSDDNSEAIIHSHPKTHIIKFKTEGFNDQIHNDIKNNCWKRSRGKADFVIVCDMDEFLYHPDLQSAMSEMKRNGQTIVKPQGYNMYSSDEPAKGIPLTTQAPCGVRDQWFDKCILFDPHSIVEINYKPGAHECHPVGRVVWNKDDFKLLHYKNIGLASVLARKKQYSSRLSQENISKGFGTQYLEEEERTIREFQENEHKATRII